MSNQNQTETIVVRAVIHNNGSILVLRRSKENSRSGEWEVPGGKLDPGESLEEGVRREVVEETGLDITDWRYDKSNSYKFKDDNRLGVIFHAHTDENEINLSEEHQEYKWVDRSTYNNIDYPDPYQDLLDDIFSTDSKTKDEVNDVDYSTTKHDQLIIFTDGGSRGNPGPSATGYVIMNKDEEVLEEGGEYLGITTNNQAEYQAVKLALEKAKKYGKVGIDFYIDSLLVVNQMTGVYKIKNRDLWPIHQKIVELSKDFEYVNYTHVRREHNKLADAKVNEVLDSRDQ